MRYKKRQQIYGDEKDERDKNGGFNTVFIPLISVNFFAPFFVLLKFDLSSTARCRRRF